MLSAKAASPVVKKLSSNYISPTVTIVTANYFVKFFWASPLSSPKFDTYQMGLYNSKYKYLFKLS